MGMRVRRGMSLSLDSDGDGGMKQRGRSKGG
jgi:hypothetical protein